MSSTTNTLTLDNDQVASIIDTMIALLAPKNHCALPVYGLAIFVVIFNFVRLGGYFVIVTVTAVVLYLLPEVVVENVKNMELLQMNNECWNMSMKGRKMKVKKIA